MHPVRIGIPLVIIAFFVIYIIYLVVSKKDKQTILKALYAGLFFTGIWAIIYFMILN